MRRLSALQKKIALAGMQINVDQYDGTLLPYLRWSLRDGNFETVFHHLARTRGKSSASKEIRRVLKPGRAN